MLKNYVFFVSMWFSRRSMDILLRQFHQSSRILPTHLHISILSISFAKIIFNRGALIQQAEIIPIEPDAGNAVEGSL